MNASEIPEDVEIDVIIASRLGAIRYVGVAINKFCEISGMSEMDAFGVELSTVEAVTNAVEHAYKKVPGGEVRVRFSRHADGLTVEVHDRGIPMDLTLFEAIGPGALECEPDAIDKIPQRGRGLAIIKKMMDHVTYRAEPEGNCLTMHKTHFGRTVACPV